jgi:hypothetical protein
MPGTPMGSSQLTPIEQLQAYFDSIRSAFDAGNIATRRNYDSFLILSMLLLFLTAILMLIVSFTTTYRQLFSSRDRADIVAFFIGGGAMMAASFLFIFVRPMIHALETKRGSKSLTPRQMLFSLCWTIADELEKFERNRLIHLQKQILQLWAKLVMYFRWNFDLVSYETVSFHYLPSPGSRLAPRAEAVAIALNWRSTQPSTYKIVNSLNELHLKVSPRLKEGKDVPQIVIALRHLGAFVYSTLQQDQVVAVWGYEELLKFAETVSALPTVQVPVETEPGLPKRVFLKVGGWLRHPSIGVAFFSWLVLFEVLFVAFCFFAFRVYPSLRINETIVAMLIGGPIAAAISMLAVLRKAP